MIPYLVIVAIANLFLGFFVALALGKCLQKRLGQHNPLDAPAEQLALNEMADSISLNLPGSAGREPHGAEPTDSAASQSSSIRSGTEMSVETTTWSEDETWSSVHEQIKKIQDRIRYAASAKDKRLTQETGDYFIAWIGRWITRMEGCIFGEEQDQIKEVFGENISSSQLEFILAQMESSKTNLESIDWNQPNEATLEQLEREFKSLQKPLENRLFTQSA